MNTSVHLKVSGDFALFSRPEMKVERVSYDVITPSAARGIFEAIYWKPQIRWIIGEIRVVNPIRFTNLRRNEVSEKIPVAGGAGVNAAMRDSDIRPSLDVAGEREQRASLLLRDVCYVLSARVHLLDARIERGGPVQPANAAAGKHLEMFKRRARKGQAFHQPYLGCREFPARFELLESPAQFPAPHQELVSGQPRDLGYILHDIEFTQPPGSLKVTDATPHFFRAEMLDGLIKVPELPFAP